MPLVEVPEALFDLSGEALRRLFSFECFHSESYELFSFKDGDAKVPRSGSNCEDPGRGSSWHGRDWVALQAGSSAASSA